MLVEVEMKIRAMLFACVLAALCMSAGATVTGAVAVNPGTCYQTGVTPGCTYIITYDDGSSVSMTADPQGRVTRPCNRIIVQIRVGVPGGGCYDAQPIHGADV